MKRPLLIHSLIVAFCCAMTTLVTCLPAFGANISLTGAFHEDGDVQLFHFALDAPSDVVVRTLGYAGGVNAQGTIVTPGGFDPVVTIFDHMGLFLDENDDGLLPDINTDPVSESAYDSWLEASLDAGIYTVALTQFDNFALGPNLSDGFLQDGVPNFTDFFACSNGAFCDDDGNNRTAAWALDLMGVDRAHPQPIPVPSSHVLLATGLLSVMVWRRWGTQTP